MGDSFQENLEFRIRDRQYSRGFVRVNQGLCGRCRGFFLYFLEDREGFRIQFEVRFFDCYLGRRQENGQGLGCVKIKIFIQDGYVLILGEILIFESVLGKNFIVGFLLVFGKGEYLLYFNINFIVIMMLGKRIF